MLRNVYIQYIYETFPGREPSPNDYIGPFPYVDLARQHQGVYGPVGGAVVELSAKEVQELDSTHVITPGQHVDHVIRRSW